MTPLQYAVRAMREEKNDVYAAIERLLDEKGYSSPDSYKTIDEACNLLSRIYNDVQEMQEDNTTDWDKLMSGYKEYELFNND